MTAPTSEVHICNLALDYLKEAHITSIVSPNTQTEVICAAWYDQTRRSVLRKNSWNFATKRVSLAKLTTTPAYGWDYEYELPNDFIRLVSLGSTYLYTTSDYQLEDGKILINDDTTLNLRYVYDVTTVTKYDSLFINMLALELAINISYKISGSNTLRKSLSEMYRMVSSEAKSVDGIERPPTRIQRSRAIQARRSNNLNTAGTHILEDY